MKSESWVLDKPYVVGDYEMMESYDKIESLDVDVVYPGHGAPFANFKKALAKSRKKIKNLIENRDMVGMDLLKKIIIYTLLMRKIVVERDFFAMLMDTIWFRETVDLYFNGEYEIKYNEIIENFVGRGIISRQDGRLVTAVKP